MPDGRGLVAARGFEILCVEGMLVHVLLPPRRRPSRAQPTTNRIYPAFRLLHIRQRRGSAVCVPLMFTSIIRFHSSILSRSSGACGINSALLIITSTRPYLSTAAPTNLFT